jgi:hypothetical protein
MSVAEEVLDLPDVDAGIAAIQKIWFRFLGQEVHMDMISKPRG